MGKKSSYVMFGNGQQTMSALARPNLVGFMEYLLKTRDDKRSLEIMNICDHSPYSFRNIILAIKKSDLYSYRPTMPIPLPAIWAITRLAGFFFRQQKKWFHSCYEKVATSLVFDNSGMLQAGFKPQHDLETIFNPQITQIDADKGKKT